MLVLIQNTLLIYAMKVSFLNIFLRKSVRFRIHSSFEWFPKCIKQVNFFYFEHLLTVDIYEIYYVTN